MLKLAPQVRLLDFDGSVVERQPHVLEQFCRAAHVVSARDLGPQIRYMAYRSGMQRLAERLDPQAASQLTLYGSGDFHHVTATLLKVFPASQPLSVVVFDRHPDWDSRSPVPCCGTWVLEALRLPHVERIVVLGLGKEDIGGWRVNVGSVSQLRRGKVALYPYDCSFSFGLGRAHGGVCTPAEPAPRFTSGPFPGTQTIHWETLEKYGSTDDWRQFLQRAFDDLPTQQVYLSVDKDCLTPEFACTNWEPGHLTLPQVLDGIALLATQRDIVGADITGEYSSPEIASPLFRWLAASDRPRSAPGHAGSDLPEPTDATLARNEQTNLELLHAFGF